jgi:hypothetical protein
MRCPHSQAKTRNGPLGAYLPERLLISDFSESATPDYRVFRNQRTTPSASQAGAQTAPRGFWQVELHSLLAKHQVGGSHKEGSSYRNRIGSSLVRRHAQASVSAEEPYPCTGGRSVWLLLRNAKGRPPHSQGPACIDLQMSLGFLFFGPEPPGASFMVRVGLRYLKETIPAPECHFRLDSGIRVSGCSRADRRSPDSPTPSRSHRDSENSV